MVEGPVSRVRKLTGLSLRDFCKRFGISKPALTNYEAGMYSALSDAMVSILYEAVAGTGRSLSDVMTEWFGEGSAFLAYGKWLREERLGVADRFMRSPATLQELSTRARDGVVPSPMLVWVEETAGSVYTFAKLLKVPQATLWRYIEGKTVGMPKQLREALDAIRYPMVTQLALEQMKWRERYA